MGNQKTRSNAANIYKLLIIHMLIQIIHITKYDTFSAYPHEELIFLIV